MHLFLFVCVCECVRESQSQPIQTLPWCLYIGGTVGSSSGIVSLLHQLFRLTRAEQLIIRQRDFFPHNCQVSSPPPPPPTPLPHLSLVGCDSHSLPQVLVFTAVGVAVVVAVAGSDGQPGKLRVTGGLQDGASVKTGPCLKV